MEIVDKRNGAPQIQTGALPPNPNPGAPPPWAAHGGPPAHVPPQAAAQPPGVVPPGWVQTPTGARDPATGSVVIDATKAAAAPFQLDAARARMFIVEHAVYPGAGAPIVDQITWALAHNITRQQLLDHHGPSAAPILDAVERFLAVEQIHPTARMMLEAAIRSGATDEQLLAQYANQPWLTKDVLANLRYSMQVPTAAVTLPQQLGGSPTTVADPGPQGAAAAQQQQQTEQAQKTATRWSKERKDKAIVMLRDGRAVADVAAAVGMPVEKVEELRVELLSTQALAPASSAAPPNVTPIVVPDVHTAAAVAAFAGALTSEEAEALRRLLGRAIDSQRYLAEVTTIDDELDAGLAQLEAKRATLTVEAFYVEQRALHAAARRKREAERSLPRALALAVREVELELSAYRKVAAILPREGG